MKKIIVSIFLVSSIYASDNLEQDKVMENFEKRIEKVEESNESIKNKYEIDLKAIENKYEAKLNEVINEKEQIKLEKDEIEGKFNFLSWLLSIVGITSIVGIVGVVIESVKIWKSIDKKVKERVDSEVSTIVNIEKKKIEDIIKKYDVEEELKVTKKICVLSVDNENKGDITKILKGFEKREYKNIRSEVDYSNYDLILINHNDDYEMEKINNLITENSDSYFFYYGSGRVNSSNMKKNFCNSIFTLYGNLIDLLRTQDLLNR